MGGIFKNKAILAAITALFAIVVLFLLRPHLSDKNDTPIEPSPSIAPSPSPSGESYPSNDDPKNKNSEWIRLDSEFASVKTRLPFLTEENKKVPKAPFLLDGCEGESCGHVLSLRLGCESRFYSDPGPKGSLAFTLPEGTTLAKARIFTLVLKPGSVRLRREKKTITVLKYASENEWLIWEDGEMGSWNEVTDGGRSFRHPVREAWVYVEDDEGRQGWLRLPSEPSKCPFDSIDPLSAYQPKMYENISGATIVASLSTI